MSRQKGNVAEREVAALLRQWWSDVEPEAEWARTPLSGGWGGASARAGFRASGDLMTTAVRFPFTVEVKRREGWAWSTLIAGKRSPVWGWWKQAQTQAAEMKVEPMLWFRRNRQPWRVLIREEYATACGIELFYVGWKWVDDAKITWGTSWFGQIEADYGEHEPAMMSANMLLAMAPGIFAKPKARATSGRRRRERREKKTDGKGERETSEVEQGTISMAPDGARRVSSA